MRTKALRLCRLSSPLILSAFLGCGGMCTYLEGIQNDGPVAYRIRENQTVVQSRASTGPLWYKFSGEKNSEVLHLDPTYYDGPEGSYPLNTREDIESAFNALRASGNAGALHYADATSWYKGTIRGPVTIRHKVSYYPWGGPSWTEVMTSSPKNSVAVVRPGRFHLEATLTQEGEMKLNSRWGVCP